MFGENTFIQIPQQEYRDITNIIVNSGEQIFIYSSLNGFTKSKNNFKSESSVNCIGELKRITVNTRYINGIYIVYDYQLQNCEISKLADALDLVYTNFVMGKKQFLVIGQIDFLPENIKELFVSYGFTEKIINYRSEYIKMVNKDSKLKLNLQEIEMLKHLSGQKIFNIAMNSDTHKDILKWYSNILLFKIIEPMKRIHSFENIGGWMVLKKFITYKLKPLLNIKTDIPLPTNILLRGKSGTGKTIMAEAIAKELGYNIYRVDTGKLYNKYLGNTEENMRILWQEIEAVSPSVILFDEIEKLFAGYTSSDSVDGGTTARLFGYMLYRLQQHNSKSVIIGTLNSEQNLPAEFLRKGRWDYSFEEIPTHTYTLRVIQALLIKYNILDFNLKTSVLKDIANKINAFDKDTGADIDTKIRGVIYKMLIEGIAINFTNFLDSIGSENE